MRQNKYVFYFIFKIYIIIRVLIEKNWEGVCMDLPLIGDAQNKLKRIFGLKNIYF
jgi:hypothetical protein